MKLNSRGEELGKYYHTGHFTSAKLADLSGIENKVCILSGVDDMLGQGVIKVIDPARLKGSCESPATTGFGLFTSEAEIYSILIPFSDLEKAGNMRGFVKFIESENSMGYKFYYAGITLEDGKMKSHLYYEFTKDFNILNIQSSDTFNANHKRFKAEGKIKSTLEGAYYENLKKQVKYWNGREWGYEKVRLDTLRHFITENK